MGRLIGSFLAAAILSLSPFASATANAADVGFCATPATKMCVADRMHDVKMYDVRKPELPAEALIESTPEAAAKGVITRDGCSFHNDALKNLARLRERVMLQGLGVKKKDHDAYTPNGVVVTITANMTGAKTLWDGRGSMHYRHPG